MKTTIVAEKRRAVRMSVRLAVLLVRENGFCPVESRTENLSCDGFYCLVPDPLAVGETLRCTIRFDSQRPMEPDSGPVLHCTASVVRTDHRASRGLYGIACRIEDFSVAGNGLRHERLLRLALIEGREIDGHRQR